jgi:MoaA/NifB/PqqE/SkfB family radical SAM enzyme
MNLSRLLITLAIHGVRYRLLKWAGHGVNPEALSLEVTHHCVARCVMCTIWKIPKDVKDVVLSGWLHLLSEPILGHLKELDITGGEPFLRSDLAAFLTEIAAMKRAHLPEIRSVAVTTNGFLTERVLETVRQVFPVLETNGIQMVLALAMDGVGEVHDRIRNVKGGWASLHSTIEGLKEIRKQHPTLILGLKTTILPENIVHLQKIAEYAREHGLFTIISPCIITSNRYANLDLGERLRFSPGDIEAMAAFYQSPYFQWGYHREMMLRFLSEGTVKKPCSAGFNYFFVRSTGEIFPCPLIDFSLGNLSHMSLEEAIHTPAAKQFRRKVGRFDACSTCTEPGLERYALPFEGFHYLQSYFRMGREPFLQLHRHMGLDKYV